MDPTEIGAWCTGLTGLLVAWASVRAQRSGSSRADLRNERRERRRLEKQRDGIRNFAIRLEGFIRDLSHTPPRRPPHMDLDWGREDEDEGPDKRPMRLVGR